MTPLILNDAEVGKILNIWNFQNWNFCKNNQRFFQESFPRQSPTAIYSILSIDKNFLNSTTAPTRLHPKVLEQFQPLLQSRNCGLQVLENCLKIQDRIPAAIISQSIVNRPERYSRGRNQYHIDWWSSLRRRTGYYRQPEGDFTLRTVAIETSLLLLIPKYPPTSRPSWVFNARTDGFPSFIVSIRGGWYGLSSSCGRVTDVAPVTLTFFEMAEISAKMPQAGIEKKYIKKHQAPI